MIEAPATLRLAMKSEADAEILAQRVRGRRRYDASTHVSYECPAPAVMTARIEPSIDGT